MRLLLLVSIDLVGTETIRASFDAFSSLWSEFLVLSDAHFDVDLSALSTMMFKLEECHEPQPGSTWHQALSPVHSSSF